MKVPYSARGPVAQLVARLNGIQEVTGSIPVRSTNSPSHSDSVAVGACNRMFLRQPGTGLSPPRRRYPASAFSTDNDANTVHR